MTRYERRYRKVSRHLSRVELGRSSADARLDLSDADLMDKNAGRRFLDFYGDRGIQEALEAYGFLDALRRRGFENLTVSAWAQDERHTLVLEGRPEGAGSEAAPARLVELVVRRDRMRLLRAVPLGQRPANSGQRPANSGQRPANSGQRPANSGQRPATSVLSEAATEGEAPGASSPDIPDIPDEAAPPSYDSYDVLTVDWLSLRNPTRAFSEARPRLPGQDVPGLGVGERVLELLARVVERLGLDGMVTVPEYFHNAVLYQREMPFADPFYDGQLEALKATLFEQAHLTLAQATWAIYWGFVFEATGDAFRWRGEAMVYPTHPELSLWLRGPPYAEASSQSASTLCYRLDRAAFDQRWASSWPTLLTPTATPA